MGCAAQEAADEEGEEEEIVEEEAVEEEAGETPETAPEESAAESTAPPPVEGDCKAQWVCASSVYKIYRQADCTFDFTTKAECKRGCVEEEGKDAKCRPPPVCTSGFKCRTATKKGYQNEDCSWIKEKECELGCENNACVAPVTESTTSTSSATDEYAVQNKTSGCTEGWKCFDAEYKVFQESNCYTQGRIYCQNGCLNGQCQ